jgi:hypothetical protein
MNSNKIVTLGLAPLGIVILLSSAVAAQSDTTTLQANLQAANGSGTTGTATVAVHGNQLTVAVHATGASPNLTHAQHIHIGGQGVCPDMSADKNNDGIISTKEGEPIIGPAKISLTTEGDTSMSSMLAVDRFPVADGNGAITYERTFTMPTDVNVSALENGVVEIHGVSKLGDDPTKYDGNAKSDLDPSLSAETTTPAACGVLSAAPVGGVGAGSGSTAGFEHRGLAVAGVVALIAGGVVAIRRLVARPNRK